MDNLKGRGEFAWGDGGISATLRIGNFVPFSSGVFSEASQMTWLPGLSMGLENTKTPSQPVLFSPSNILTLLPLASHRTAGFAPLLLPT